MFKSIVLAVALATTSLASVASADKASFTADPAVSAAFQAGNVAANEVIANGGTNAEALAEANLTVAFILGGIAGDKVITDGGSRAEAIAAANAIVQAAITANTPN